MKYSKLQSARRMYCEFARTGGGVVRSVEEEEEEEEEDGSLLSLSFEEEESPKRRLANLFVSVPAIIWNVS